MRFDDGTHGPKTKMMAGELNLANDYQLEAEHRRAQQLLFLFNTSRADADDERRASPVEPFNGFGSGSAQTIVSL